MALTARGALLIAFGLAIGACGEPEAPARSATAKVQRGPQPIPPQGPADRRTDPGFRPVDADLPRLSHEETGWQLEGEPVDIASLAGKRVVLLGKMILGDPSPYRNRFQLGPHYHGCVDPLADVHRVHVVDVQLPEGESVYVTDHRLEVEGVLEVPPTAPGETTPRLAMRASRVNELRRRPVPHAH